MKHHNLIFCAMLLLLSTSGCVQDINRRLLLAAERGDVSAVQTLVDAGAVPDGLQEQEWTPLQAASFNGHVEVVRTLLSAGAQVNIAEDTPLMLAVWKGHAAITKVLLEADAGFDVAQTYQPIEEAAAHGHASILIMLVAAGVDVNQTFSSGWTALMAASFWN